jgi:hypothetical protein
LVPKSWCRCFQNDSAFLVPVGFLVIGQLFEKADQLFGNESWEHNIGTHIFLPLIQHFRELHEPVTITSAARSMATAHSEDSGLTSPKNVGGSDAHMMLMMLMLLST